jgi:hypothetical protein
MIKKEFGSMCRSNQKLTTVVLSYQFSVSGLFTLISWSFDKTVKTPQGGGRENSNVSSAVIYGKVIMCVFLSCCEN